MSLVVALCALALAAPEPEAIAKLRAEARTSLEAGKAHEAVGQLEAAARAHPESAGIRLDLGSAQLAKSDFAGAAEAFRASLELEPSQPVAQYNLAYALRESGALDEAVTVYRTYLDGNPGDADAWYGLGQTLERKKAFAEAAAAYESYASSEKRPQQKKWVESARALAAELKKKAAVAGAPSTAPAAAAANSAVATQSVTGAPAEAPTGSETPQESKTAPSIAEAPAATAATPKPSVEAPVDEEASELVDAPAPTAPVGSSANSSERGADFEAALTALRSGRFDDAMKALQSLPPELREADYAVLAARAGAYLGKYDGNKAAQLYAQALSSAPDAARPSLLLGLAEAQRISGQTAAAKKSYDQALALPDVPADLRATVQARRAAL